MADADTEQKRRSVLAVAGTMLLPTDDGTIDTGDRSHLCLRYSGIDAANPSPIVITPTVTRRIHRGTRFPATWRAWGWRG